MACASSTRATDIYHLFALFLSITVANKICQPTSVLLRCFAETKSIVHCLGAYRLTAFFRIAIVTMY